MTPPIETNRTPPNTFRLPTYEEAAAATNTQNTSKGVIRSSISADKVSKSKQIENYNAKVLTTNFSKNYIAATYNNRGLKFFKYTTLACLLLSIFFTLACMIPCLQILPLSFLAIASAITIVSCITTVSFWSCLYHGCIGQGTDEDIFKGSLLQ